MRTNRFETFLEPASLPLSSDATTSDKSVKRGRSEDRTLRRETYDDPFNEVFVRGEDYAVGEISSSKFTTFFLL